MVFLLAQDEPADDGGAERTPRTMLWTGKADDQGVL